ncbi:cache domain-containing protein [Phaeobacter gallaeciensis]|uniref:cache domain-containing protein n=1 Tax=Phaeobacter gallaeciensis TaxID=60890 RepID=UPI00237F1BD5|nr:cache domain-containing protein [Phaeobacter gallaeciensis]MDE4100031.1 cache domain-containing protein [Phaeobacter gallaeciensis]MDE4108849.1 cache domain-containing protein [Phaeobacter gallaeciensis]MDE4113295.1 cache domain-containing protein [Phaeobacter gallaeciensis]MDE4117723.1 cache domain-containing protein [Phaeobacter gallaeciensis]MDE4122226.1 cache domain-containing protein [Phaeobacter gallaeciensis]
MPPFSSLFSSLFRPNYAQKLSLLATLPLVVAVAAIALLVANQSRALAEREIKALERQLIEAKKAELRNYVTQARNAFSHIYGLAAPDDADAKERVTQILSAMIYGQDGFFFVYDYDGNNLVSPRQTEFINQNWRGLTDSQGTPVVDTFIEQARQGAGWHSFMWEKPSTGEEAQMVTYVLGLQDWQWAVGTGVFIDDVLASVAASRAEVEARVRRTFIYIGGITLVALVLVFASGMVLNIRERRLADAKLKELTQRVFDAQEEERGRVARELHDGISQLLVGVRYALDNTRRRLMRGDHDGAADPLDKGIENLGTAISEVRRISRDLRPGVLDDLGLGPALKALTDDFAARTGIETDFTTVVFRNRLDQDAKIAMYRIAQEALTNIERHADASHVSIDLRGHARGATMRISDNGRGLPQKKPEGEPGIGLRNMQERIDQLDGTLRILSSRGTQSGTVIEATLPLSHLLPPGNEAAPKRVS